MPRHREKPIHPYIQRLMDERGHSQLKQLADDLGMDYEALKRYANMRGEHQYIQAIRRDAHILGLTTDEFIEKLLAV